MSQYFLQQVESRAASAHAHLHGKFGSMLTETNWPEYYQKAHRHATQFRTQHYLLFGSGSTDMNQLMESPGENVPNTEQRNTNLSMVHGGLYPQHVSAGGVHSVALLNGTAYSWGAGDDGALGRHYDESNEPEHVPCPITGCVHPVTKLSEDNQILMVATGAAHSLLVSLSGVVYTFGHFKDSDSGKFAEPNKIAGCNATPIPVRMPKSNGRECTVQAVATHGHFNAALLNDGTVVTWGFGNYGELARSQSMVRPNADGTYDVSRNLYLTDKGFKHNLIIEQYLTPKPVLYNNPAVRKEVLHIGTGNNHLLVVARTTNLGHQQLYTAGLNASGQLGHNDTENRHELTEVEALQKESIGLVAGGDNFSVVVAKNGRTVYSFGLGNKGQLGIGFLPRDGHRLAPAVVPFPEPIFCTDISCGGQHVMAICNDKLYSWGFNELGATGLAENPMSRDTYFPIAVPGVGKPVSVSCGGQHSLVLIEPGTEVPTAPDGSPLK